MLRRETGLTQQKLCVLLGMFPSRLVALLDGLEDRGLVERRQSATDRRSYKLVLTPAGRRAMSAVDRVTRELERDLFGGLTAQDIGEFTRLLARVMATANIAPGVHPAYRRLTRKEIR